TSSEVLVDFFLGSNDDLIAQHGGKYHLLILSNLSVLEFSLGYYCIYVQKRFAFAEMCKQVTDSLMEDNIRGLDVEILNKVSDGTEDRLKVRLTYKELCIPDCFVQANLITLK
ncbi:unnamed protein product, partial [Angiostrongylus costaricensis]|uniref:Piezo_RRas_bdg domain-containing protein n=1 Tax=Angiostrongylus costaricensis TaxID=334426 RepID=A0A0R3PIN2_ANGCS